MPTLNEYGEIGDPGGDNQEPQLDKRVASQDGLSKQVAPQEDSSKRVTPVNTDSPAAPLPPPDLPPASVSQKAILHKAALGFFGVLGVLAIALVLGRVISQSGTTATPAPDVRPTVVVERPTMNPDLTLPSPTGQRGASSETPTTGSGIDKERNYKDGVAAYMQEQWEQAAKLFQQIYDVDASYRDIREKLSATYYNWGAHLLKEQNTAQALKQFENALMIEPEHTLAQQQKQRLDLYLGALDAVQQRDWVASIAKLETLHVDREGFLDGREILYTAYMNHSTDLEQQNQDTNALQTCRKAAALKVRDASMADACVKRLTPASATPVPNTYFNAVAAFSNPKSSGNSGQFASCVGGRVTKRSGGGIDGAVVNVNNGPANSFSTTTGGGGYYKVCNLGASNWSAVLYYIPGAQRLGNQPSATVYVNGASAQNATVNFVQR